MEHAPTNGIPLWIDSTTGDILLGDHMRLSGGMQQSVALARSATLAPTSQKLGGAYSTFKVQGLLLGGLPAHLTCQCNNEVLQGASFGVVLPDPELIDGWPSQATSEREVAVARRALQLMFGPSFDTILTLPWGLVFAGMQERDMLPNVGIRYVQG